MYVDPFDSKPTPKVHNQTLVSTVEISQVDHAHEKTYDLNRWLQIRLKNSALRTCTLKYFKNSFTRQKNVKPLLIES